MRRIIALLTLSTLPLAGACNASNSPMEPGETALASVSPAGGSVAVDPAGTVRISFDHAIMGGMEQYAALHEGGVTGTVVAGTWALSADRTGLRFTPSSPLEPKTSYTIHLGGGMMDAAGHAVDMDSGRMMGGQYATGSMMNGGMMGGSAMMGSGWKAANGTYGMLFSFTTA